MRQNFRKILAVLTLCISVVGLTACGSSSTADTVSYDEDQLQSVASALVQVWDAMSEDDIESFLAVDTEDVEDMVEYYYSAGSAFGYFTADSLTSAFSVYESSADDLGDLVAIIDYEEPTVKSDEITLNTNIAYEKRNATLSIVFNKKGIAQSVTLDPKYSLGEILGKALMNTILGMGTVFAVLIFISLIIYCFNFIPAIQAKFSRNKINLDGPKATAVPKKTVAAPAAQTEELIDDGELVAAITAAICAYTGSSSDGFVVRSIKRAESAKWKRA
jgi:sodium pump decarboxylase gamma subunit